MDAMPEQTLFLNEGSAVPAWRRAHAAWRRIAPLNPTVRPQAVLAIGRVPRPWPESWLPRWRSALSVLAIGSQRCRVGDRLSVLPLTTATTATATITLTITNC